jgi:deazaflavin-dependent oxidoreductase (nitroreductase family)
VKFVDSYRRWFSKVASTNVARNWLGPKVVSRLDRLLYLPTHGGLISLGSRAYPTLLLSTTGHRTGRSHTVPLFFLPRGRSLLVVASNFGRMYHPGWSANLLRDPVGRVQVRDKSWPIQARLLTRDEKDAVWSELIELFDGWQGYENETLRSIRVFSLDPA